MHPVKAKGHMLSPNELCQTLHIQYYKMEYVVNI